MKIITEGNASVNMDFVSCFFLDKKAIAFYGAPAPISVTPSAVNDYVSGTVFEPPLICRFLYENEELASTAYKRITSNLKMSNQSNV